MPASAVLLCSIGLPHACPPHFGCGARASDLDRVRAIGLNTGERFAVQSVAVSGLVTESDRQRQDWEHPFERLRDLCAAGGLDLARPLQAGWYNDAVEDSLHLPDFGRPESLAVIIGNTRAMWAPFLRALHARPDLRRSENPVDAYAMSVVESALAAIAHRCAVRWAHVLGAEVVAMQRLAQIAGLAYLSPAHLSVHPTYGPWISLRAVVVFDVLGPPCPPPSMERPCRECEVGCRPAFSRAVEAADRATWRDWLAVRDACPLGREFRYSDAQIEYHYTKDPSVPDRANES
jgi:methylmalonic aciduria homocystinuria type C protein